MAKSHFNYKKVFVHHILKHPTLNHLPLGSLSCRG